MIEWMKPGNDVNPNLYLAGLRFPHVCYFLYLSISRMMISRILMKGDMGLDLGGLQSLFPTVYSIMGPTLRASFPKGPP